MFIGFYFGRVVGKLSDQLMQDNIFMLGALHTKSHNNKERDDRAKLRTLKDMDKIEKAITLRTQLQYKYKDIKIKTGVSKSTVSKRIKALGQGRIVKKVGRPTALGANEDSFIQLIGKKVEENHPLRPKKIVAMASAMAGTDLSHSYYLSLLHRREELLPVKIKAKEPERIDSEKLEYIQPFFNDLKEFYNTNNPHLDLVINADESFLMLDESKQAMTVISLKSVPMDKVKRLANKIKEHNTLHVSVTAGGLFLPSFLILQNLKTVPPEVEDLVAAKRPSRSSAEDKPYLKNEWFISSTDSGWQDSQSFLMWMDVVLVPYIKKKRQEICHTETKYGTATDEDLAKQEPALLLLDQHYTRTMDKRIGDILEENNISMRLLPGHTTHFFSQPTTRFIKSKFNASFTRLFLSSKDKSKNAIRGAVLLAADRALLECHEERVKAAWKTTGIWPLSPEVATKLLILILLRNHNNVYSRVDGV
jgi:hypothetical protein